MPAPSADAFLDESTPPKADDYLDAFSQPVSAAPKPVADDFLDQPGTQERAQQLAADTSVDTAAHAASNPEDYEAAFQAQQLRDSRSLPQKAGAFAKTLRTPSTWGGAAAGAAKFGAGLVTAPLNTLGRFWHASLSTIGRGVGANDFADAESGKELRDKAESVLAGQNIEESLNSAGRGMMGLMPNTGSGDWTGESGEIPIEDSDAKASADAAANEARARSEFADKVQSAKNAAQLAQGRPLQGGAVAAITGATGTPVSELTPEALQEAGAPPARPLMVDTEAAAANPENLALAAAPELPVATYLGGKMTQVVGKVLQVPGKIAESIPGRIGKMTSGPVAAGITAAETAIHNPAIAAKLAAGVGSARYLQWLGRALDEQGGALSSGAPSALDTAAANARLNGTGSVLTDTQRVIGDAASRGAATAVGMAPANLALSGGDPEDLARQTAGAAAFGGATDLLRSARPALVEAARPALRQKGLESQDLNTPEGRQSSQFVQGLPDAQRNTTLELQGALAGLPVTNAQGQQVPARMIVLPDAAYKATVQKLAGDAAPEGGGQGFFWAPDGTAYINGEHSQLQSGSNFAQVAGHEFAGHAAMNMLQAMGAKGGPIYDGIVNSAKAALYNPDGTPASDFQAFVDNYNRSFDPTGQHKQIDPSDQNSIDEFLAETAGRIISQRGAADIALPASLLDRVTQGVGTFMAGLTGMDPRSVGNGRFGQKEVADLSGAVRDSLIQLAGAKLRPGEGEGAISRPQTPEEYVQELQETLAKPRPTDTAENVKAWLKEQAQARKDLSDFQGNQSEPQAPSNRPQPPSATTVPTPRGDAIRGLTAMGIKPDEAAQRVDAAAAALGGTPSASDLITAVRAAQRAEERAAHPQTANSNVPAPTATQTQPLSEGSSVATASAEPAPAPAPKVQDEPAPGVAVGTPDDVASKAEADAISKEKYGRANTGAGKKRVQDAKVQALAEAGKQGPNDLHIITNATGEKSLVGDIDPENPYHAAILKELGISADDIKGVTDAQALAGTPAYIRYRSAKSDTEGSGGEGTAESIGSATKRADEIAANPAEDRKESTIQHKVAIPLDTTITKSGGVAKRFFVLSDLLHNAQSIFEWMKAQGVRNPFGDTPEEQQQGLVADAQAYAKNHANGWNGLGTAPMQGFPDSGFPPVNPGYQPTVIPKERFDVLNAMFNDEKAVKVGDKQAAVDEKKARVDAAKTPGAKKTAQGVYERAVDALRQSEELQNLNRENGAYHDPSSNETNELRKQMKDSKFEPKKGFYSVIQNLSPDHILDVSDQPIPHQPGDVDSIRPSGFDVDPSELAKEGFPNTKAVAAGFSPDEFTHSDVRPSSEAERRRAMESALGRVTLRDETAPIDSLSGGVRADDPRERTRIDALKRQMQGEDGYLSRPIADSEGNVFEGQHRLEALRELGAKNIPITRMIESSSSLKDPESIVSSLKGIRREQAQQIVDHIGEIVSDEGPESLDEYDPPKGFESQWNDAVRQAKQQVAGGSFSPDEIRERLTPERMMVNIRNYGANRTSGRTPADYREAIAAHLGGNAEGGEVSEGAQPTEDEQSRSIVQWADQNGVAIRRRPWNLNPTSKKNAGGVEHDVFPDESSRRWIKTTKLGNFGEWPTVYRIPTTTGGPGELSWTLSRATPEQYLQRIDGTEKLFDIKTPVHGVIVEPTITGKMLPSIVTSQPDIQGTSMIEPEIEEALGKQGFLKIDDGSSSYYRKSDNTAVLDAHPGNVAKVAGKLVAYDAIVMEPTGELRQIFERDHDRAAARTAAPKSKRALPSFAETMGETPEKQESGFSPDEGTPEEGGNAGERLAREAEAAGVPIRVADVVALMKMDPETTERIRARIAKATGKPARFSPDTQTSPQSANGRRFVPLASIQAQQRQRARAAQ